MRVIDALAALEAETLTSSVDSAALECSGAYVSDLLSDVMGRAEDGQLWLTIMRHLNVVAVASLRGLPAIIFTSGVRPEDAVVAKAEEEGVVLATTALDTFTAAGRLYTLLHA